MSALGQKQTFAVQNGMSALPPKADMCSAPAHVRFVPIADMRTRKERGRLMPPPFGLNAVGLPKSAQSSSSLCLPCPVGQILQMTPVPGI